MEKLQAIVYSIAERREIISLCNTRISNTRTEINNPYRQLIENIDWTLTYCKYNINNTIGIRLDSSKQISKSITDLFEGCFFDRKATFYNVENAHLAMDYFTHQDDSIFSDLDTYGVRLTSNDNKCIQDIVNRVTEFKKNQNAIIEYSFSSES